MTKHGYIHVLDRWPIHGNCGLLSYSFEKTFFYYYFRKEDVRATEKDRVSYKLLLSEINFLQNFSKIYIIIFFPSAFLKQGPRITLCLFVHVSVVV